MFKKIDVILIYEHISRELTSLLLLKHELEDIGLSCIIIPIHFNKYLNIILYKPRLIVLPFLYSIKNETYKDFLNCYTNVQCLNLHHEQFYSETTKSHLLPSDSYSKNIYHIAWSKTFKNDLLEVDVLTNKIFTLGNLRSDTFFLSSFKDMESLRKKYDKCIFVPTTFSWALVDEDYFLKIEGLNKKNFYETKKIALLTAKQYFIDFYKLSSEIKNILIILRPHPFEDINKYTDLFLKSTNLQEVPSNILITREYDVYEWMKISDLTIGWWTTVNMEASLFNKANIIYQPYACPEHMKLFFFQYYKIITNYNELKDNIMNPSSEIIKEYKMFINENFGKADGKITKVLAKKINYILKENISIKIKSTIYKTIYKTIKSDFTKILLLKINMLHKIKKNYAGLLEENLSQKEILEKYKILKKLMKNAKK